MKEPLKINRIILRNYAAIYSGMRLYEVDITIPDNGNVINMIDGINGSGKTAMLSAFHPFAYNKVNDNRESKAMILEGRNGYKYISYNNGVECEHFLDWKGGKLTVKSYIKLDGSELNPNGNVTSFEELVEEYLEVTPHHLSLLRLGSNVTDFTKKTFTERKNYASSLMPELQDFLGYYKNVSNRARENNTLIKSVVSKIERIPESVEDLKSVLERQEDELAKLKSEVNEDRLDLGYKKSQCSNLWNGEDDIASVIKDTASFIVEREKEIEKLQTKFAHVSVDQLEREMVSLTQRVAELESNIDHTKTILEFDRNRLTSLYSIIDVNRNKLSNLSSGKDIHDLEEILDELNSKINRYENDFPEGYKPPATVEEYHKILATCQNLQPYYSTILGFGSEFVRKALRLIETGNDLSSYAKKQQGIINAKKNNLEFALKTLTTNVKRNEEFVVSAPYKECVKTLCPYIEYYKLMNDDGHRESETTKTRKELAILNAREEEMDNLIIIGDNYKMIKMILSSSKGLQEKCEYLTLGHITQSLKRYESSFFDEGEITELIEVGERYSEYISSIRERETHEYLLSVSKQQQEEYSVYQKEFDNNQKMVMELERGIIEIETNLNKDLEELETAKRSLTELEDILPKVRDLDKLKSELDEKKVYLSKLGDIKNERDVLLGQIQTILCDIEKKEKNIALLNNVIVNTSVKLRDKSSLLQELQVLKEEYDKIHYIRESVGVKGGIPLYNQQIYLENSRKIMNELLEIVYHDRMDAIVIDQFEIDHAVFKIPYIKNGIRIDDIRSASGGELKFLSIALSFALMSQRLKNYNIVLLDEMDSELDDENRKRYIELLEALLKLVGAGQCFIISHNEAFDNHNINVITTRTKSEFLEDKKRKNKSIEDVDLIWYRGKK